MYLSFIIKLWYKFLYINLIDLTVVYRNMYPNQIKNDWQIFYLSIVFSLENVCSLEMSEGVEFRFVQMHDPLNQKFNGLNYFFFNF